jgi:hypothetical protein
MATKPHGPGVVDWALDPSKLVNPLRPDVAPTDHLTDDRLRQDVAELLFRGVRNASTWDHLGSLNPVTVAQQGRHVRIDTAPPQIVDDRIDFVDLPVGLGLLFDVATSEEFEVPRRRLTEDALAAMAAARHSRGTSRASSAGRHDDSPVSRRSAGAAANDAAASPASVRDQDIDPW